MKVILIVVFVVMLFLSGCGNLTWTPTAEEWAEMTYEQRNAWSDNERRARRDWHEAIRKNSESNRPQEPQKIIIVPQNYIDLTD